MGDDPVVFPGGAVVGVIPDLDFDAVGSRFGWQGVGAIFIKPKIDVENAFIVIAPGQTRQEVLIDECTFRASARKVVKIPDDIRLVIPIEPVSNVVGWQVEDLAHEEITCLDIKAIVAAIGDGVAGQQLIYSSEETDFLNLRRLSIGVSVIQKFERVQIDIAGCKDVEMNVIEAVAKGNLGPPHDVSEMAVGRDKPSAVGVCLVRSESLVDDCGNRILGDVMILPNITFLVKDGDFPVIGAAVRIIFDIYNLTRTGGVDRCAVCCDHVDAMMEVGIVEVIGIKLVGAVEMPHLLERKGPVIVVCVLAVGVACGNTGRASLYDLPGGVEGFGVHLGGEQPG